MDDMNPMFNDNFVNKWLIFVSKDMVFIFDRLHPDNMEHIIKLKLEIV